MQTLGGTGDDASNWVPGIDDGRSELLSQFLAPSVFTLSLHPLQFRHWGERLTEDNLCILSNALFFKLKNGQHYFNFYFCLPAIAKTAVIGNKSVNTFARAHSTAVPLTCTCVDSGVFSC